MRCSGYTNISGIKKRRNHRQRSRSTGRQARMMPEMAKETSTPSSRKGEEGAENKRRAETGLLKLAAYRQTYIK